MLFQFLVISPAYLIRYYNLDSSPRRCIFLGARDFIATFYCHAVYTCICMGLIARLFITPLDRLKYIYALLECRRRRLRAGRFLSLWRGRETSMKRNRRREQLTYFRAEVNDTHRTVVPRRASGHCRRIRTIDLRRITGR